jgi:hypothetical protein
MPKPKPNQAAEFARKALGELIDGTFYKGAGDVESQLIWMKAHAIKREHQLCMLMGIEGSALRRCGMDTLGRPKTAKRIRRIKKAIGD